MGMRRYLRPGFVVPSGERLWVVDEFQPVAAVLEPGGDTVEQLVSWPQVPAPPVTDSPGWHGWRVLGVEGGLWAQPYPGGPVGWIDTAGLVRADYSAGLRLAGVTTAGAWCGPQPRTRSKLVQRPAQPEQLLCLTPDGSTRTVTVDRPVGELRTATDGLYVCVRADPTAQPQTLPHPRDPDPGEVWLHLPAEAPLPQRLTRSEHGDANPPPRPEPLRPGNSAPGSPWHRPTELSGHEAAVAGGLRWQVGWDRDDPGHPRPTVATGHDRQDGAERRRIQLGGGRPVALTGWGDVLWVAVRRTQWDEPAHGGPVELLRLDAHDGQVESVLPAESVDITEHCWPLCPKPVETDSYAEYQRGRFNGLADHAEKLRRAFEDSDSAAFDGNAERASGNRLRSVRVELSEAWPDTAIHLRCTHADYPGLELVRALPLFDELGRQHPPEQAGHHLLEAVDAGTLPPASQAHHGQLSI